MNTISSKRTAALFGRYILVLLTVYYHTLRFDLCGNYIMKNKIEITSNVLTQLLFTKVILILVYRQYSREMWIFLIKNTDQHFDISKLIKLFDNERLVRVSCSHTYSMCGM